jgi:hypothetical protein
MRMGRRLDAGAAKKFLKRREAELEHDMIEAGFQIINAEMERP